MSDHVDGPRQIGDPPADITDLFAFTSPENAARTVLAMCVFPSAGETAVFSNVIDYRIAVRRVTVGGVGNAAKFEPANDEIRFSFRFGPLQRDAAGLIVFDEEVANYVQPSTRQGQLFRLLHAIENAQPGTRTDFTKPFVHFQNFLHRRGIVVVLSDFYEQPDVIVKTVEPLRYKGNEIVLFHVLDPQEIKPKFREPVLLVDMEDARESLEVSPEYAKNEYRRRIDAHIEGLASKARGAGMDYFLMNTERPLDEGLREYLAIRRGKL